MQARDDDDVPDRQPPAEELGDWTKELWAVPVAAPEVQRPGEDDGEDLVFAVARIGAAEGVVCEGGRSSLLSDVSVS